MREERSASENKEALKAVWKYYMLAFAGVGLLWVSRYLPGPLDTILTVVGALIFFTGVFIVLYWDRKARKQAMDNLRAEAEAEKKPGKKKSK